MGGKKTPAVTAPSPAGATDSLAGVGPAILGASDLVIGHFYRFKFEGTRGVQPYEFLGCIERTRQRERRYRFRQAGTGASWIAVASMVTRYLICEEPATSAPEKISPKTPGDSGEVAPFGATLDPNPDPNPDPSVALAALEEFRQLDKEAYDKADELGEEFQALMRRFDDELLPLVDRMQAFLSIHGSMHIPGLPSWGEWRSAFLKKLKTKMSVRTLQRRLKHYRDEEDAGEKATKHKVERVPVFEEPHASKMCKEGAHLARLVKSPLVSRETLIKGADTYLEKLNSPTEDDATVVSHSITPRLNRREAPTQTATKPLHVSDKDAVLYGVAQAAAVNAANAVEEETIEARFYPFIRFWKLRKYKTFLSFLEKQGIKKDEKVLQYSKLPCGEPYRTYEEALAYVEAFAKALPDLGSYHYGVVFMGEEGTERKVFYLITRGK